MIKKHVDIETDRLLLRRWQESDLEPFIKMNQDAEVMRYFPDIMNPEQTIDLYNRIQQEFLEYNYGLYAAEEKISGQFIGFTGFHWARMDVDFCPCVEIGWRLDKAFWGQGYATEGAKACLQFGFHKLNFHEVHSFTAVKNKASQRVMQKNRMQPKQYFEHPGIAENHPLRPHVCYRIERN